MFKEILFCFLPIFVAVFSTSIVASADGLVNVNEVIPGKLIRSGSSTQKALTDETLFQLCNDGFTLAIFSYKGAKTHDVTCNDGKTIRYLSMENWKKPMPAIEMTKAQILNRGKVLIHSKWGDGAANFVTSVALTQLCGFTGEQATAVFKCGLRGIVNEGLLKQISAYKSAASVIEGCPKPVDFCN